MKNKFYKPRPFKERVKNFFASLLFWKGRKKGMIHTRNITWNDIRAVFFPKDFHEKYHYLGSVPWDSRGDIFEAMEPLVIFMDYKAKPWWCPRWFLRFLHLFGMDNSIIRVRNRVLSNLLHRITKGILLVDYKTKWSHFDLRISIAGSDQMWFLADAIEHQFYNRGYRIHLVDRIKEIDPTTIFDKGRSVRMLEEELNRLEEREELSKDHPILQHQKYPPHKH